MSDTAAPHKITVDIVSDAARIHMRRVVDRLLAEEHQAMAAE